MGRTKDDKAIYFAKFRELIESHKSVIIVNVDNVGSNQMHKIRQALRGTAQILMGKNTMVRRALRTIITDSPQFERILPLVKENIGFVFTNGDLKEVRETITTHVIAAPARVGAVAPIDVYVPAGNTGMEPGKTSFFQALNIPTKIARGTIEIVSDVHLLAAGQKVGSSEATLLNILGISPFTYGMKIVTIYSDGQIFDPKVLDIEESTLIDQLQIAIRNVAALSLAANFPTLASVTHSLVNSYKNLLAVALATDVTFEGAERAKAYLANPEAFAVAAAPVAAEAKTEAAVEEKEEDKEESDEDMGFGMFD